MKPKNRKLVQGVGTNDADYAVAKFETIRCADGKQKCKLVWMCPYYKTWASMLNRCYSAKFQERYPTYAGCTVSEDWHVFSNFRAWMKKQDWEGFHLDKDLLFQGNKIYSADTCVFVSRVANNFTIDSGASIGGLMIGACWDKASKKFQACCRNPFTGRQEHLGRFTCEQQAHNAWLKRKLELAHELASIQTDPRVAKALIDRYSKLQIYEVKS